MDDKPDNRVMKSATDGNGEKYLGVEDQVGDSVEEARVIGGVQEDIAGEEAAEWDRLRYDDTARMGAVGVVGVVGRVTRTCDGTLGSW